MNTPPKLTLLGHHVFSGKPGRRVHEHSYSWAQVSGQELPCNGSINTDITFDPSVGVDMYKPSDIITLKQFQRVIKPRVRITVSAN